MTWRIPQGGNQGFKYQTSLKEGVGEEGRLKEGVGEGGRLKEGVGEGGSDRRMGKRG